MQLRVCKKIETLDFIIQRKIKKLSGYELEIFYSAADHRLAELVTNQLYSKIPAQLWRWVK